MKRTTLSWPGRKRKIELSRLNNDSKMDKNGFDQVKKPIRPNEGKDKSARPQGVSAKDDTILKSEFGPKYPEFK